MQVIEQEQWRRDQLHHNADYLRHELLGLGYNVTASRSQIIGLEAGKALSTMQLRDLLEEQGVFGAVFAPPATPKNRTLLRLSVHAGLKRKDLQTIVEACHRVREPAGLAQWPSSRRMGARAAWELPQADAGASPLLRCRGNAKVSVAA